MAHDLPRARDLALLDAVDALQRTTLDIDVWRLVRAGRDPLQASPSRSRWCNASFDVLYTSLERDGAIGEIDALLSLQPVLPSKDRWFAFELSASIGDVLDLSDMTVLAALGIEPARYADRVYEKTQSIADAAFFLGFTGLLVPSARWSCSNLVLFADRVAPDQIRIKQAPEAPIDWKAWRKTSGR